MCPAWGWPGHLGLATSQVWAGRVGSRTCDHGTHGPSGLSCSAAVSGSGSQPHLATASWEEGTSSTF